MSAPGRSAGSRRDVRWESRIDAAARAAGVVAGLVGAIYLLLWLVGVPPRWSARGVITMKANLALALVVAGAALNLLVGRGVTRRRRAVAGMAAAFVLAMGALTLAEHLLRVDLRIDQVLASEPPGAPATAAPNRMGPPGAAGLVLVGAGLLALALRRRGAAFCGAAAFCVLLVPTVGLLYGVGELYGTASVTGIARPAIAALLALAAGLTLAHPQDGPVPLLWRRDPGGVLLRRLVPPAVLLPIAVGWLRLQGEGRHLYETSLGTGLFAVALVVMFLLLVCQVARGLSASAAERDGTERALRESEERLRLAQDEANAALRAANERLLETDRRRTEFLGVLSHELRNPLAPIRNGVFLLERLPSDSPQAARAREAIRRQAEHLTRLVDELLDVTRISRGKIQLHREVMDLRELVRRACEDHRALFEVAGVELRCQGPADPVWAEVDATRITQVVGNLLANAHKFTPAGGSVLVSLAVPDGHAEIRVRDTGMGIRPEQVAHMFEPFAQEDRSLARTRGGLGLGLALSRGLVELHGGTISAFSEGPGKGAEIAVTLPTAQAPQAIRATAGAEPPAGRPRRRVLIIEDNGDAARTLADVLELAGHEVTIAPDGATGIARARELKPDAVICDVGLPDVDGYEVARTLRGDESLRATRLIALSGYAQPEDRERAREAGFEVHLPKPAPLDDLSALLR